MSRCPFGSKTRLPNKGFNEISRGCTKADTEVPLASVLRGTGKKCPSSNSNWEISPRNIAACDMNELNETTFRNTATVIHMHEPLAFFWAAVGRTLLTTQRSLFPKSQKEIRVISPSCFFPRRSYVGATKEGFLFRASTFFFFVFSFVHSCVRL